tara:strand:- start:1327 stop:2583 length:1257 start_codon:yes stop_codon:yes gene_type:complete
MTIRDRKTKNINFNQSRTFGIELEMTGYDTNKAVEWLQENNYTDDRMDSNSHLLANYLSRKTGFSVTNVGGYRGTQPNQSDSNTEIWEVKTDGSVNGMGLELVSHILKGNDGIAELKAICNALNEIDATVDTSSGVHVHHSKKGFSMAEETQLINLYTSNAIALSTVLTASRINSGYGGFNNQYDLSRATSNSDQRQHENASNPRGINTSHNGGSRVSINLRPRYTIEFRQHSGTTDFNKLSNWIYLTQAFMNEAKRRVSSKSAKTKNLVSISMSERLIVDSIVMRHINTEASSQISTTQATKVFNAFTRQAVRTMIKSLKLKYVTTNLYPTDDAMNGLGDYLKNRAKELTINKRGRRLSDMTTMTAEILESNSGSYTLQGQKEFNKQVVTKAKAKAQNIIAKIDSADWDGKVTKLYQ